MLLIDTHCHLNDEALLYSVGDVIEEAKKAGVKLFIVPGWDKQSSEIAVKLAETYDCVYAAVGYHPENLDNISEQDFNETLALSNHPKVVAVGEIGLDYHWEKNKEKQNKQKEYFIKQIQYANDHNLPIIVHAREAQEETLKILKEYTPKCSGVCHCFSGSLESMKEIINLQMYIGVDGPVTFKNAVMPKKIAEETPLEFLLLETDSPYLPPHPLRGTINEPKNIRLILDEIETIRGISKKHIADIVFNNALRLFNIKYEEKD